MIPTSVTTASSVAPAAPSETTSRAALSSDFDMFLKLLTTQMRNQDPLNPADATAFATQLATFSSVEQQILTNDLLRDLLAGVTGGQADNATSWLGAEVLSGEAVAFRGRPVDLVLTPETGAETSVLVVTDPRERVVQRLPIEPGTTALSWTGAGPGGAQVPPGDYRFSVDHFVGQDLQSSAPVRAYATVQEVRFENAVPRLVLDGGASVAPDEIDAVRRPGAG